MALPRFRLSLPRRLSGLLAGVTVLAAVSGVLVLVDEHVPALSLAGLYLLAVVPVAFMCGPGLAVAVSATSVVVFALLFLDPVHLTQPRTGLPLAVFLLTAVIVAVLTARSRRRALQSTRVTEEQAALRRVATLVAQARPSAEIFDAVTREIAQLSDADVARLGRFDDDAVTNVAAWSRAPRSLTVGRRFPLEGESVAAGVRMTGGAFRLKNFTGAVGPLADEVRVLGLRSGVGCPIIVAGRMWGVIAAMSTSERQFPPHTEAQLAAFTELVATAIANAQSRTEITDLLEDQAALRRVATLVARGTPAGEVVSAVASEVGRLLGTPDSVIVRQDPDGLVTVVARTGDGPALLNEGTRWRLEPQMALATALATGRPSRRDGYDEVPGAFAAALREMGVRSAVAIPIVVGRQLWGALAVATRAEPLPAGTEERLSGFAELVAIAVGNAESAADLAASRARVVTAADEARRRIERDLHDGAQQRLVALGLELRLAQDAVPPQLADLRRSLGRYAEELTLLLDELREISRGIHPAVLSEGGLAPALRMLARRSAIPVEVHVPDGARFPEPVEVAAYYVVSEALTNTAKYARASRATVTIEEQVGAVRLAVRDDGTGGADPANGSGLTGIRDRVEALGGAFEVSSPAGEGTVIQVVLSLRPA